MLIKCFNNRLELYLKKGDCCANKKDCELTPDYLWDNLYNNIDYIKNTTADIFPFDRKWTRYHHFCGFS